MRKVTAVVSLSHRARSRDLGELHFQVRRKSLGRQGSPPGLQRASRRPLELLRATEFPLAPEDADVCVVAIAGPVIGGLRSAPPFISWAIDFSRAVEEFGVRRTG